MTDNAELAALRNILAQSLARIDQLEAEAACGRDERDEQRTTRRGILRLAGAAAVGGLAATVVANPAAAADPDDLVLNSLSNALTSPTGISASATSKAYGLACYEAGLGALSSDLGNPALLGHATNTAFNVGVAGHSTGIGGKGVIGLDDGSDATGVGVKAQSTNGTGIVVMGGNGGIIAEGGGYGIFALSTGGIGLQGQGRAGALSLVPWVAASPPSRSLAAYRRGVMEADGAGNIWYCCEDGTPGRWRKLAGPGTAGAFHPITPTRVYDSRAAAPTPGPLASGSNRLVSVADGRNSVGAVTAANIVAEGATAVAANITITGTTGTFGYLAINPGGNTVEGASTINWSAAGLTIANGVTLTLNAARQLTVICNGGGSTHVIIDIAGYYL